MYYVYLLKSLNNKSQKYVGYTSDLEERLLQHNYGKSEHTARYKPWELVTAIQFTNKEKAIEFEQYLKSQSGRAFAEKRFW